MGKLRAITLTAFQETLHRRVFYIVLLVAVLIVASIASQMILIRMATEAGEADLVSNGARSLVTGTLSTWTAAVMFLALFVGAIGISSEINAKTIVHVLSRPVDRWVYLFGRWFGTLMFLWMFLSLGIAVALLIALGYGVPHTPALWLGLGELFVSSALFSGVALAMSVVMPPVLAGSCAFLLMILPGLVRTVMAHPRWWARLPARIGYYIAPAQMPGNLISDSFSKEALDGSYWTHAQVLAENALYVAVALMLASIIFARREIRVR